MSGIEESLDGVIFRPKSTCVGDRRFIGAAVIAHTVLLAVIGLHDGPNLDETGHLPAGLSHWEFGNFTLYRVNPPLIRMWAAAPLLVSRPETDWSGYSDAAFSRSEFTVGSAFHVANGQDGFCYFTLARWVLIPVSLIGAWVCFRWATELFDERCGLLALVLWCFCPNMLTWGASITPDMGSAAFGVLAGWRYWKWLKQPSWKNVALAGLTLGIIQLTKTTWIVLFGLWPALWCIWRLTTGPDGLLVPFRQLVAILCLGLYLLNMGYGFEDSGRPLGEFTFISETLGGEGAHEGGGNRFRDSWLGRLPVPVPANYLRGIDVQKYDFEQGKWSYLAGEQKKGGWWYYYLYAFFVKSPVGYLALIVLASGVFVFRRRYRAAGRDELLLIVPALVILLLVSSQTGFNRYLRYILPAFPFVYIFASRAALAFADRNRVLSVAVVVCLTAGVASSLSVYPHCMSYFNYAVGGPSGGRHHLLDGNVDWGQDLLRFKSWVDEHPEATPLHAALTTFVPLDSAGIEAQPISGDADNDDDGKPRKPLPGWYAISVNQLMGYKLLGSERPECMQFQDLEPVDQIGYSIYIYRVEDQDTRL